MSVKPYLDKVGKFTVEQLPCPHFSQPVNLNSPRTGVLHTTEGGWDGSIGVFKSHYAPHFMIGAGRIAQLVQVGTIGAALVTHNWLALVQVEVVGFSKETPYMFDDATAEVIAAFMAECHSEYSIPLSRPWADGIYGKATANDPHRAENKFGRIAGWYGHGDMPSPDSHWDPGNLEWAKLFSAAMAMEEAHADPTPPPIAPVRPCCPVAGVTA